MLFRPLTQSTSLSMAIVVRTASDPGRLTEALTRSVSEADPDQPTYAVRTMEEVQAAATATRRFSMQMLGGFAFLALLLAAIGIYGVMAYLVAQRTREIGIRVALGARPASVVRLIVSYALAVAGAGVALGFVAAVALTRVIAGMLFQVSPTDPWTFGAIAVTLMRTAILAAATPARRAARVDPMTVATQARTPGLERQRRAGVPDGVQADRGESRGPPSVPATCPGTHDDLSVPSLDIRCHTFPGGHSACCSCSSLTYAQYACLSRLATRAPRSGT